MREPDAWTNSQIGWNLGKMGRDEEAVAYLQKAVDQGRDDAWVYSTLAWNLGKLEKIKKLLNIF